MARMDGLEPEKASWYTRLIYWVVKRKVSKLTGKSRLVEPVKIMAWHPRILKAYGQMEMGEEAATSLPAPIKALADMKAATLIGCPY